MSDFLWTNPKDGDALCSWEDIVALAKASGEEIHTYEYRRAEPTDMDCYTLAESLWNAIPALMEIRDDLCPTSGVLILERFGRNVSGGVAWNTLVEACKLAMKDHLDLSGAGWVMTGVYRRVDPNEH